VAEITKVAKPSLCSILPDEQVTGLIAGEALDYFALVYIKTSDGKVYNATGAANTAPATVRGIVPGKHATGDKDVTIYFGSVTVNYATGLTAGTNYFLSGTNAGGLADAASTGGLTVIAFSIDTTRIRFLDPH
jgi:hypothetical protein